MTAPRVSVLLPVRNGGPALRSALRSLERQTFRDFEIVAVNDGSTDGTGELLDAWRRRDPRLLPVHRPAEGLVAALNAGLERCRGVYVARMDADDAMLPRRLERQVSRLDTRSDLDVVACRVRCFPRHCIGGGFRVYEDWLNALTSAADHRRERFIESPIAHPTAVVRTEVLRKVGGYRDLTWAEDYDLWLRLTEAGSAIEKVPEVLHLWRDHPGRQTRVHPRYSKKSFLACKAHYLARGPLRGHPPLFIWGAGPTGRQLRKALDAEGVSVDAFFDIDAKKLHRRPGGRPVHHHRQLEALWRPASRLLIAVSRRGARDLIRPRLYEARLEEGEDAFFVA
ncbi:MAG: glycosyltransferase [Acidobacteriota bacterium]